MHVKPLYGYLRTLFSLRVVLLQHFIYPGYQRFFLLCVGKLRFVGRRPTRVRQKAENTSDEAADHFLRLDRNLKPRMKSLWHPGYTLLHIHTQITTKKGGTVLRCNATRKSSIHDKDKGNEKKDL